MVTCRLCGEVKFESDFYPADIRKCKTIGRCKECAKKTVRKNRKNNIDYYTKYEKERANLPHRIEARIAYTKTEQGKKARDRSVKKYTEKHPLQRYCTTMVGNAVRDKRLFKPKKCSICGKENTRIHGHHDDYAYPLQVRWLCAKCHFDWHACNTPKNLW